MKPLIQALSCHLDHDEEVEEGLGRLEAASGAVEGPGADEDRRGGRECATGVPGEEPGTGLQGVMQTLQKTPCL